MVTRNNGREPAPIAERLADRLAAAPAQHRSTAARFLHELGDVDLAVYRSVAATPTPLLDGPMRRLSGAANHSMLWLLVAAGMSAFGGRTVRRAAGVGVAAIAVNSAVVNLGIKAAAHRVRPDRDSALVPPSRRIPMPMSTSFPSGHSASGFAFANAVGATVPAAGLPLRMLACAVGYSRVHTGVHYPGDVIVGAMVGATLGEAVGWALARRPAGRRALRPRPRR